MAYKFQIGAAQLSGALTQEGAVTAEGLASLDGGIDVNGSNFTVSTAGAVVAESTVSGAAGTFDALAGTSLALQSGGITAAGAIAGAASVSGSGVFSMSAIDNDGVLNNQGAANIVGKLTVTAVSDLDGGIDVNNSNFTVSAAGAVVAESTVSGAAATFDALAGTSLALQSGGITAAGAIAGATTISGSSTISGHALDIETTADLGGKLTVVGVSDLDGGIDVNASQFTVSAAGAVAAVGAVSSSAALEGLSLDINSAASVSSAGAASFASANLNAGGITNAGAIAGATTVSGSGVFSMSAIDNDGVLNNQGALNVVGLSSLDGGIDVNGNMTVSAAGAIAGATTISGSSTISGHALDIETTADLGGKLTVVGVSDLDGGIDVNGSNFTVAATGHMVSPSASIADLYVSDDAHFVDTVLMQGALTANAAATFAGNVTSSAGLHITNGMGLIVGGSGEAQIDANGNLSTSGDISGSIVDFQAGVAGTLRADWLPSLDNVYDLGSPTKRWNAVYAESFIGNIAFDTQTYTNTATIAADIDLAIANSATAFQLDLPAGADGKVVRIKSINDGAITLSASVAGETIADETNGDLVVLETAGAAVTCVFSGSSANGDWYII